MGEVNYSALFGKRLTALTQSLTVADRVPEVVLATNESRMGMRVPEALRCYYATAGNRARLNQAHNRLLAPDAWRIDRDVLVFLSENQCVVKWGVRPGEPGQPDPLVLYTTHDGHGKHSDWAPEELPCSDFLRLMLCWQAVHGGLPHTGWTSVTTATGDAVVERFASGWRTRDLRACYRPGQVVCIAGRKNPLDLLAAGRSEADFDALVEELAGLGVRLELQ